MRETQTNRHTETQKYRTTERQKERKHTTNTNTKNK